MTVSSCTSVKEPAVQGMWGIFQVFADTIVACTLTAFALLSATVDAVPVESAENLLTPQSSAVMISLSGESGKIPLTDSKQHSLPAQYGKSKPTFVNAAIARGEFDENGRLCRITAEEIEGVSLVTLAFAQHFGSAAEQILSIAVALFAFSTVIGWSFYGERGFEYLFGKKSVGIYRVLGAAAAFAGAVTSLSAVWGISDIFNGLMILPNLIGLFLNRKTVVSVTEDYLRRRKRTS